MNLWSVFVTGLLAGGASCTLVQRGLLASAIPLPCAVLVSVMIVAVGSGSPVAGALGLPVSVVGATALFAALGYGVRRAGALLRGCLGKAAAAAVIVAGLLSINSGLALSGSS